MQRPLRKGLFIVDGNGDEVWISFKYENLPTFYFGCGRLGHGVQDCGEMSATDKDKAVEDFPYTAARGKYKFQKLIKKE